MINYVYLFVVITIFLVCVKALSNIGDKSVHSDYYPTSYNSAASFEDNEIVESIKMECLLCYLVVEPIIETFLYIIYYPKKILVKYIQNNEFYQKHFASIIQF